MPKTEKYPKTQTTKWVNRNRSYRYNNNNNNDTSNDNAIALTLQESEISALLYNVDGVTLKPDVRKDTATVNVHQKEQVLTAMPSWTLLPVVMSI